MIDTRNRADQEAVLAMRQITKEFPGVVALDRVDLTIGRNELVGWWVKTERGNPC